METKKKETLNKGITLIALVITIIVLLILAVVAITTLIGDNGLLNQADKAKTETTIGEEKEAIALAYNGAMIETNGESVTAEGLNKQFSKNGTQATASGEGTIKVNFNESGRSYTVNSDGTAEESYDVASHLTVGDYVYYPTANDLEILCRVLYNDDNYGIQLVSVSPVSSVMLGRADLSIPSSLPPSSHPPRALYSYNNAIKYLNDLADSYGNPKFSEGFGARCVGSNPNLPYSEGGFYSQSSSLFEGKNWGEDIRDEDANYVEDWERLGYIGARKVQGDSGLTSYWLASRRVYSNENSTRFGVRRCSSLGKLEYSYIFSKYYSVWETPDCHDGLRPVFRVRLDVKFDNSKGKNGTEENPYILL